MEFKLFKKLGSLEGMELVMLIAAAAVFTGLLLWVLLSRKKSAQAPEGALPRQDRTRALVAGALSITLSFVLSYMKLFSLPFGGSITLLSMLPIVAYACCYGPGYGFLAGFAYSLLQVIQGAYIVHWAQFLLDYFVAFTVLGVAGFFPKKLPLALSVAGFCRLAVSTVSGAIFFADSGLEYGIANPWAYSLLYNALTIGADTVLCLIVTAIPSVRRAIVNALRPNRA